MLWLHETHHVRGAVEDEFEASIRDEWLRAVARIEGVRLLYFLKHAHGTGAAYRVVTITGLADAAAWQALSDAVAGGTLTAASERLDELRYDVIGKLLVPLPWARAGMPPLESVPTKPGSHPTSIFMEDTVWPREGLLERYIATAGTHYAAEMAERGRRAILAIEGAYRTAHGTGRRREIVLWQRVQNEAALGPLITSEVPERLKRPGTWMHDALELRDQWESRLLRTASWSPLF